MNYLWREACVLRQRLQGRTAEVVPKSCKGNGFVFFKLKRIKEF